MKYDEILVGERLKEIREYLGYTREDFAEKLGISISFLSKIENGKKEFSVKTLIKLNEISKFSTDYILFGNTEDFSSAVIKNVVSELSTMSDSNINKFYKILLLIKEI